MQLNRVDPSSERGVAMLVVLMALVAGSMLAAVTLSAAGADLPFAKASQDRKQAHAAAEAGMAYYMYQLSLDNDYWTRCDQVPGPAPGQPAPVNQKWDPKPGAKDPRVWRKLPGSKAEYTLELIPDSGTSCVAGNADGTMIDRSSGTFRIRASGRSGDVTRTLVNTLRRSSFLDYIYFTDYETADPITYPDASSRAWAEQECVKPRAQRHNNCTEIQFSDADAIRGPFHTNDSVLHCNTTQFGRGPNDRVEVSGPEGFIKVGGCNGNPDMQGTSVLNADPLEVPPSNSTLATTALPAYRYTGKTTILLKGNVMDVTRSDGTKQTNVPLPSNGVIYVSNSSCSTGTTVPMLARYNESSGCGNLYITGTYSQSLTIATANDIIVGGPGVANGNLTRDPTKDVVLGLIATNFVRVYHPVTRSDWNDENNCTNAAGTQNNVTIDAAILTLKHSFTVDNYRCGAKLQTLRVMGAIAQKFRGPVGTTRPTGYTKDYEYDDRLKYRSPPFFLDPVSAAWKINRAHEQVPATAEIP